MPARHTSHQDSLLLEANSKPGGSGRRKRVSARHQVKRPDRSFRRSSLFPKYGPAEEPGIALLAFFIRCGSVVRNFTGALAPRWDLTLTCSPTPSFPVPARVCPPAISVDSLEDRLAWLGLGRHLVHVCAGFLPVARHGCGHGYRFANARVNQSRRLAKIPVKQTLL
jgi:hypothetical protein